MQAQKKLLDSLSKETKDASGRQFGRQPRVTAVKNKAPAPVQISAEQILREALDRQDAEKKAPVQKITDADELESYRLRKRKEFEDTIRRSRMNMGCWIKYAQWEASQREFDRARSIWERALDIDYRNTAIWQKYTEMEMKNRFINRARNLYDRVVSLLPRVDNFWYRYAHMEEMLGNIDGARQVFERWMQWHPDPNAWGSYINLELRHRCPDRAREIYERFLVCHPTVATFLQYANFESKGNRNEEARAIFERAMQDLGDDCNEAEFFLKFAQFEERNREFERARVIYKYGLERVPKHLAEELYRKYTAFEKQHGDKDGIEGVIVQKRRLQYEEDIKSNKYNYDVWFDYIRLEESNGNVDKIRDVYERAISTVPPLPEKHAWKRYIYLWINYALFEELDAQDMDRTEAVYLECLKIIPHQKFTFGKIWLMTAQFYVRQKNLEQARKILGNALGRCPKQSLFKGYIQLELQLGNMDRCRKLYEKFLETFPDNCYAWAKFAELEKSLSEVERARAIFELGVAQTVLDTPEQLWKNYIDFEIEQGEHSLVRNLYDRLLDRTKNVKVWISRAQFEASVDVEAARRVFQQADHYFKQNSEAAKEERVMLLESWRDFEKKYGSQATLRTVLEKLPKRIRKKRMIKNEDGSEAGWEEYFDYLFPDEPKVQGNMKLLENVRKWKKQKTGAD